MSLKQRPLRVRTFEDIENVPHLEETSETAPSFDEKYFIRASTLGAFPGTDTLDAIYRVRGELGDPHLSVFPELPDRGYHATRLARSICCLEGLTADGTASGWRIRQGRAEEHERAFSLLHSDINALADVIGQEKTKLATPYKVQLMGPVSLAASVYLNNGELLISDAGARRDILQSFAEGITPWIKALHEASHNAPIVLQLSEPYLEAAMGGTIPTSSGYKTHRNIPLHEVESAFSYLDQTLKTQVENLIFEMPENLKPEVYRYADGIVFSLEDSTRTTWESLASHLESDRQVFLGVQNPYFYSSLVERSQWFLKNWRTVGLPFERLVQVTFTETQPMVDLSVDASTKILHHIAELARAVSEGASDTV